MKICEAIKEAYEKACLNKENDGDCVISVSNKDRDIIFEVSSDGSLEGFNEYDWKADDFSSKDWRV